MNRGPTRDAFFDAERYVLLYLCTFRRTRCLGPFVELDYKVTRTVYFRVLFGMKRFDPHEILVRCGRSSYC